MISNNITPTNELNRKLSYFMCAVHIGCVLCELCCLQLVKAERGDGAVQRITSIVKFADNNARQFYCLMRHIQVWIGGLGNVALC